MNRTPMPADQDGASETANSLVTFYRASVGDVFRYFNRATFGDRALAEDLTQETFVAAVRSATNGRSDMLTMPWIMSVAHNKLVDHHRKRWRDDRNLAFVRSRHRDEEFAEGSHGAHVIEALDLLRGLPDRYRVILAMRYIDDLPVADIARTFSSGLSATQSALTRARRSLERSLIDGVQP